MHLYLYGDGGRHVLASDEEVGESPSMVVWVSVNPEIEGSHRRGRPPGTPIFDGGPRALKVTTGQVTKWESPTNKVSEVAERILTDYRNFNAKEAFFELCLGVVAA